LILIIGFSIGYYVESYRINAIQQQFQDFEVSALDLRIQSDYFRIVTPNLCSSALKENLKFADRIYNEGLVLEKYEDLNELRGNLLNEKKKYVLLKTGLWLNSILLKERCDANYHTVVYFYSQNPDQIKEAEQAAISKTLKDLKEKYGNSIILLPIAADLDLASVNAQLDTYNITYLPSILIDEKTTLTGFKSQQEIEDILISNETIRLN
jgi:hypothetical protein